MRLFIGIGLPSTLSQSLAHTAPTLIAAEPRQRVNWTPPENMHVTLSFLGQVQPARLAEIQQALSAIKAHSFHLQLDGPGVFATAGILYAHIKPSPALLSLAEHIFDSMQACGFPREQRPYTPHITLARGKGRLRLLPRGGTQSGLHQAFQTHEFRLYESVTRPQGAHYEVRKAFLLG